MTRLISPSEFAAAFDDPRNPVLAMKAIADEITAETGITLGELRGHNRSRSISRARQLLCYKAHALGASLPSIGAFINKHHTSVLAGVQAIQRHIAEKET